MRISVDATSLLLRSAGIKNYTYYWIQAMREIAGDQAIDAFPAIGPLGDLNHERSMLAKWQTYPRLLALYGTRFFGNTVLDAMLTGIDLFHTSNQVRVAPRNKKLTATIHDLTCWLMPELHTEANVRADREFADRIWKKADALIAVSENTRRDAIEQLGVPEDRVVTIHSGVAPPYFHVTDPQIRRARAHLHLDKLYVLSLGTVEPRKNIDRLLDAWTSLPKSLHDEFELIVAGPQGWSAASTMARLNSGQVPSLRYLGYVPEDLLAGLTAGASVFAYPSLYEGFGFPVAQAMAAAVPVLTSNTSCLPEIAGDGALYADPLSEAEIRDGLHRLLTSLSLRSQLGTAGRQIAAARYQWPDCARHSLALFERVIGE